MRKILLLISIVVFITACGVEAIQEEEEKVNHLLAKTSEENEELELYSFDNYQEYFVSVKELTDVLDASYEYDPIDKSLTMSFEGREFYLVYEVPVLEIDGVYKDSDRVLLNEDEDGEAYVTESFIEIGLETNYELNEEESKLSFSWTDKVGQTWALSGKVELDIHSFSVDEMIDYLSFLETPIEGTSVSTVEGHLPGATRDYRSGTHEGIDWYDYTTDTVITTDTPIYGMAEGVVVRVDDDFEDYHSHEIRDRDLNLAVEIGYTPAYIVDRLRGKQVWVQYDHGVMSRFAHLESIPDDLEVGQVVTDDTIIGYVGNSGTSGALNQDGSGLHLHQDLLIYGDLFWEPFNLNEAAQILQELW